MADEVLNFRQIHPSHLQSGVVSSEAFRPTAEHKGLLSLYDGRLINPEASWKHYTDVLKKQSSAVYAVASSECAEVSLAVIASPEIFPEHCHLDFNTLDPKKHKNTARKLRDRATARGSLYSPSLTSKTVKRDDVLEDGGRRVVG